jgi:hypothetical protein
MEDLIDFGKKYSMIIDIPTMIYVKTKEMGDVGEIDDERLSRARVVISEKLPNSDLHIFSEKLTVENFADDEFWKKNAPTYMSSAPKLIRKYIYHYGVIAETNEAMIKNMKIERTKAVKRNQLTKKQKEEIDAIKRKYGVEGGIEGKPIGDDEAKRLWCKLNFRQSL